MQEPTLLGAALMLKGQSALNLDQHHVKTKHTGSPDKGCGAVTLIIRIFASILNSILMHTIRVN